MLLAGCTGNDDFSGVAIIISPSVDKPANLFSGEKTLYDIKVTTESASVSSLKISSFDPENGMQLIFDSICASKEVIFSYVFTAPQLNREKAEMKLTFEATDNEGNRMSVNRTVIVKSRAVTIAEQTGIILYMPGTGLPDALTLSDVSRPFVLAEAPRPDTADVYLQTDPDFGNITLRSNTQTKFIRANNFNYSNASATSINAVYAGSIPADFVPELNINDIIIVGHSSAADGVFQVADIRRENIYGGYVRLNYKGIAHAN